MEENEQRSGRNWITLLSLVVPVVIVFGSLLVGYIYANNISIRHEKYLPIYGGGGGNEKLLLLYNLLTVETRNEVFVLRRIIRVSLVVYLLNLLSFVYYYHYTKKQIALQKNKIDPTLEGTIRSDR